MPNDLLDIDQLAEHTGIAATWLQSEADGGRIPSLLAGRRRLFNPAAVERVLLDRAAATVESQTESQAEVRESVAVPP